MNATSTQEARTIAETEPKPSGSARQIHAAVRGVMHDIAKTGIAKLKKNQQQGYNFRGVEDAMNELSPLLVNRGITVEPTYSELHITEREKGEGKAMRFCTIKGSFKFEAEDGSHQISEAYGEAMDSGDKALTKAQSVAFRTALFQKFVVPFMAMDPEDYEGGNDAAPPAPEFYAQEDFAKNLQSWRDVIASGKQTADRVIGFIESKGRPLTEEQKNAIRK